MRSEDMGYGWHYDGGGLIERGTSVLRDRRRAVCGREFLWHRWPFIVFVLFSFFSSGGGRGELCVVGESYALRKQGGGISGAGGGRFFFPAREHDILTAGAGTSFWNGP